MSRGWLALFLTVWVFPVLAGERVVFGPAGDWVRPAAVEADAPGGPGGAGTRLVLLDQQYRFSPAGDDAYLEKMVQVRSPEGLDAMGTVGVVWNPETETLTVHRLRLLRDGRSMDLLAGGPGFTVLRREGNLDAGMLDGELTATFLATGLQVGDVIDLAYTVRRSDPALGGVSERFIDWPNVPVAHLRVRAEWDDAAGLRWRMNLPVAGLREASAHGRTELSFTQDDVQPVLLPDYAPARFREGRSIEVSGFGSWGALGAHFAGYYADASRVAAGSALDAEIARIEREASDPAARAMAALRLVEERVRYLFVGTGNGRLVPAAAEVTWQRRFGDCKAKSALLLALLHGLGIEAAPVLVNTERGDGLNLRLPMAGDFDHVIVRAVVGGSVYWLDGTRTGDRSLTDLPVPAYSFGLPVADQTAGLVAMMPRPLLRANDAIALRVDAQAGLHVPAAAHAEEIFRGDDAIRMRGIYGNMSDGERDYALRERWSRRYEFFGVRAVSARYDAASGEERLTADGSARLDWQDGRHDLQGVGLGFRAHFSRPPGVYHDAPFSVTYPFYVSRSETILLPRHNAGFMIQALPIDRIAGGVIYHRSAVLAGNEVRVEASERSLGASFPAGDAGWAARAINSIRVSGVSLFAPEDYVVSQAEGGVGLPGGK